MHRLVWLAFAALFGSSPAFASGEHCSDVHGRYSIYANGDRLWVNGSKHLLSVVVDPLDKQLEKMGWERTVAYGEFVICSERPVAPLQLTIQDKVRVKSYSRVRFVQR